MPNERIITQHLPIGERAHRSEIVTARRSRLTDELEIEIDAFAQKALE